MKFQWPEGWRFYFWVRALGLVYLFQSRAVAAGGLWPGSPPLWYITCNSVMEAITSSYERTRARKGAGKLCPAGVDSLLLFLFTHFRFGERGVFSPFYPRGSKWKQHKTKPKRSEHTFLTQRRLKIQEHNSFSSYLVFRRGFLKSICWTPIETSFCRGYYELHFLGWERWMPVMGIGGGAGWG